VRPSAAKQAAEKLDKTARGSPQAQKRIRIFNGLAARRNHSCPSQSRPNRSFSAACKAACVAGSDGMAEAMPFQSTPRTDLTRVSLAPGRSRALIKRLNRLHPPALRSASGEWLVLARSRGCYFPNNPAAQASTAIPITIRIHWRTVRSRACGHSP